MNLLCKKYCRLLIAVFMITVLYGKSVICIAYDAFSAKFASVADAGEISAEDSESGNENPPKPCKKPCPDMEHGLMMLSVDPFLKRFIHLNEKAQSSGLPLLYEKVPTQPPLLPTA